MGGIRAGLVSGVWVLLLFVALFGVVLNVPVVRGGGFIYIRADGSVDPQTAPISSVDNITYTFSDDIYDHIVVQRSDIIIDGDGHALQGIGNDTGLLLYSINNITIQNANIKDFETGIWLYFSSNNTIVGNNITANSGISVGLSSSSDNRIIGNTIASNGTAIHETGIYVENSSNNNNSINENEITSINWFDIFVSDSSNGNSISHNNVTSNTYGIWVSLSSDNNSILENRVSAGLTGIALQSCSNNSVSGNSMSNMELGILLEFSSYDNGVSGNNVTATSDYGIYLNSDASNNTISENWVAKNAIGIGISSSSENSIYHNNFVDNIQQIDSYGSTNLWDDGYPSGGNYWTNFTGLDLCNGPFQNLTGSDGIGDSPHTLDADNTDNYPLAGVFSEFDWTSLAAPEQRIQTISNSTISNLIYNGTAISFDVTGDNGTSGFCRIRIPKVFMNSTFQVFVNSTEIAYTLLPCSSENYSYLYFSYTHSTEQVIVIPEFPSFLILPLFTITTLLTSAIRRRKKPKATCVF